MNDLIGYFFCLAVAALLATIFYWLGHGDGYAKGARNSDALYEDGKRVVYKAAYHVVYNKRYADVWAYRQKRMGGKP